MAFYQGKYVITGHTVTQTDEGYALSLCAVSFPGGVRMEHTDITPGPGYHAVLPTYQQADSLGRHIEYWYGLDNSWWS